MRVYLMQQQRFMLAIGIYSSLAICLTSPSL